MMIPEPVIAWVEQNGCGRVTRTRPVGGGCINHGAQLETTCGETFFLKTNPDAPADMFAREVEGLEALRAVKGPRAPQPYLSGPDFLLLEDLNPGARNSRYWTTFGEQLAQLHLTVNTQFGFLHDNYIGSTPQPNPWFEDGARFFGEQRLLYQAELAGKHRLISTSDIRRVEQIARRLPSLVPVQPASLIHGDLWGGNAISDSHGDPAIIDPAVHYGWAEAELAMTTLFGSFPASFYQAYQDVRPLEPGFQSRYPLYNLYHLLNHLNLFGSGYLGQVLSILDAFSKN
jgi:fructosamine-3-kinase